jgi:hypothetical protein
VGLLWAAWAMITPGHGQSRTKASRSGPADLPRPGQKGSSGPCLRIPRVAKLYRGQNPSREGGLISEHLSL